VKIVSDLIGNGYRMETWDIRERDIDLLLIEELYASPSFRQHFLQLLGGEVPSTAEFIAARHKQSNVLCPTHRITVRLEQERVGLIAGRRPAYPSDQTNLVSSGRG
jgi:hypothetical protein